VLCLQGFPLEMVVKYISKLKTIPGRLESYGGGAYPRVIVDYAHTPEAIELVLDALREQKPGRLTCVFGCGGDRDRGKRSPMLRAALSGADNVVVTSDNPRMEDPENIIVDVLEGYEELNKKNSKVQVITDRAHAINQVIENAEIEDVILIAGKGHEKYQEIKGIRYPFSDVEYVKESLGRRVAR